MKKVTLSQGDTLSGGKYCIEDVIGQGTFGQVYKARDTILNRPVALKELRRDAPGMAATTFAQYVSRFRREAQLQAQFNHPHIVHVYELIDQGETLYLVMEYVGGSNLCDYLTECGLLPIEEAVRITLEILEGLETVHEHPLDIVHRDIKPSNILLTTDGQAKLTDFGLAQLGQESGRSLGFGKHHPGTPLYMSPEQERTVAYLRPRSDLYSLGCVLFELLTGRKYKHLVEGSAPSATRSEAPSELDAMVLKALKENERDRYQEAAEFKAALADLGGRLREMLEEHQRATAAERWDEMVAPVEEIDVLTLADRAKGELPGQTPLDRPGAGQDTLAARYDKGKRLLRADDFAGAQEALAWVVEQEPGYRDAAACLDAAREGRWPPLSLERLHPILGSAERLRLLQRLGRGAVSEITLSRDGRLLALGSSIGVWLYDTQDLQPIRLLTGHTGRVTDSVNGVTFSPDGKVLASSVDHNTIQLWRVSDWSLIHAFPGVGPSWPSVTWPFPMKSMVFSPDGAVLASMVAPKVNLLRVADGALLYTLSRDDMWVRGVTFSPDGTVLALVSGRQSFGKNFSKVELVQVTNGAVLYTLEQHKIGDNVVAFSPDGKMLASAGDSDNTVRLWQVADGRLLRTLEHTDSMFPPRPDFSVRVSFLAFSPDGVTLASGCDDRTVRLWRIPDGTLIHTMKCEGEQRFARSRMEYLAFSPDGEVLVASETEEPVESGDRSDTVQLWQVSSGKLLRALEGRMMSMAFSSGAVVLVSISNDGSLQLQRVSKKVQTRTLCRVHSFPRLPVLGWGEDMGLVNSMAFSPDSSLLASAGGYPSPKVWLWQVSDGTLRYALETYAPNEYRSPVTHLAFSPDGTILAAGSEDGRVRLWRAEDGALLHTLAVGRAHSITFSPDGTILALLTGAKVQLWQVSDGSLLRTIEGHREAVSSIAFSPDGATLASGSADKTVRLWRVSDGKCLRKLQGHTSHVLKVAFSPDGTALASWSVDRTVRVWRVRPGLFQKALLRIVERHNHLTSKGSFAFPADEAILDQSIDIVNLSMTVSLCVPWEETPYVVSETRPVETLEGITSHPTSSAFSQDGRLLALGFQNGKVLLWGVMKDDQ